VPAGQARLRITLSAAHEEAHVDALLDALADLPQESRVTGHV
jgi:8-amino-7-oxononanoate synthase